MLPVWLAHKQQKREVFRAIREILLRARNIDVPTLAAEPTRQ